MENYFKIKGIIDSIENDVSKVFNKHQYEAAIRARRNLQEIRKLSKQLRADIQISLRDYELSKYK